MTEPSPRRLVMIVDNHVDGDSRVQKMAISAAEAGFDVTLVGRSRDTETHTSTLGSARVVLVHVPLTLTQRVTQVPGRSLRWPLAYPSKNRDTFRSRDLRSAKSSLDERVVLVTRGRLEGTPVFLGRIEVVTRRFWVKVRSAVHVVRHRQFATAVKHRKTEPSALDRRRARLRANLPRRDAWRRLDPTLVDFDLGYTKVVLDLEPDLIHAHDFRMVGIGVRTAEKLRATGHPCRVVYDAHEFMPGVHARNESWRLGNEQHEQAYARRADAVITVSSRLAEMLVERHALAELPTVVLNAPPAHSAMSSRDVGVRDVCRLSPTDPLLVYIGSPAPQRGIMTIVESLAQLPGVHAAAVLPAGAKQAALLLERADELGVRDRFHLLPYVEPDSVVDFIRSADIGVIPIHHQVNHEISLITKYFDYVHAGLPIIVSDVETMGRTTRELGNGEVFTAGSTDEFATAVRAVLADRDTYAKVYTPALVREWSWEVQAERLVALYDSLVPRPARPEDVHA